MGYAGIVMFFEAVDVEFEFVALRMYIENIKESIPKCIRFLQINL